MKFKYSIITSVIFFLILIYGCKKEDNPVAQQDFKPLFDLEIGNQWTYFVLEMDTMKNILSADTVTLTVYRDTVIGGQQWFFWDAYPSTTVIFSNQSDGLWYANVYQKGKPIVPKLFAKHPASINDSWSAPFGTIGKLLAIDKNISIPFGNFQCNEYSHTYSNSFVLDKYFVTYGVGIIKVESYTLDNNEQQYLYNKLELLSYKINNKSTLPKEPHNAIDNANIKNKLSFFNKILRDKFKR